MARLAAQIKLGYYPLPAGYGAQFRKNLVFPSQTCTVLDPCVGTGAALLAIANDPSCHHSGVELDGFRAAAAADAGINVLHVNIFDVRANVEQFSLLYLNPPYDTELGAHVSQRMESLFLEHTYRWLKLKGVLMMVVPHQTIHGFAGLLSDRFTDIRVFKLTHPGAVKYDQVVIFAVRKNVTAKEAAATKVNLVGYGRALPKVEPYEGTLPFVYQVPPSAEASLKMVGLPLDALEDLLPKASGWKQAGASLLPKQEVQAGKPLTPLHGGHVGLLCTAGMLNGVFGEGDDRHIARWRPTRYEHVYTEYDEEDEVTHRVERFSNELALVYSDGRTCLLNETPKEDNKSNPMPEVLPVAIDPQPVIRRGAIKVSFEIGRPVMTIGAQELLIGGINVYEYLNRHKNGDWGDVSTEDSLANEKAVASGDLRIFSSYLLGEGKKLWIITEADRSSTTLLLPEEY